MSYEACPFYSKISVYFYSWEVFCGTLSCMLRYRQPPFVVSKHSVDVNPPSSDSIAPEILGPYVWVRGVFPSRVAPVGHTPSTTILHLPCYRKVSLNSLFDSTLHNNFQTCTSPLHSERFRWCLVRLIVGNRSGNTWARKPPIKACRTRSFICTM